MFHGINQKVKVAHVFETHWATSLFDLDFRWDFRWV